MGERGRSIKALLVLEQFAIGGTPRRIVATAEQIGLAVPAEFGDAIEGLIGQPSLEQAPEHGLSSR